MSVASTGATCEPSLQTGRSRVPFRVEMSVRIGTFLAGLLTTLAASANPASGPPPEPGCLDSVHGCRLVYERYIPAAGSQRGVEVLLAHGFRRDLETMRGWARHWRSLGIATTVMTLCNSTWFNGRHARNADDLQALATEFHAYYNSQQFLVDDENLRNTRLNLIESARIVLAGGLALLGIAAPESM